LKEKTANYLNFLFLLFNGIWNVKLYLYKYPINNYTNPVKDRDRKIILLDNYRKSGVYMFTNKINSKRYIGSAKYLNIPINRYFNKSYLENKRNKKYLIIKALNKYGINNFVIFILEYTDNSKLELLSREQYWINKLSPEYNVLKIARNSLGFKHSIETKLKSSLLKKGKKMSLESNKRKSESLKLYNSLVNRKHISGTKLKLSKIAKERKIDPNKRLNVIVKNVTTGVVKKYKSIRETARDLKADTRSIRSRISDRKGVIIKLINPIKNILFRNKYLISLALIDINNSNSIEK
jgi:group I intron endonuclease